MLLNTPPLLPGTSDACPLHYEFLTKFDTFNVYAVTGISVLRWIYESTSASVNGPKGEVYFVPFGKEWIWFPTISSALQFITKESFISNL